MNDQVQVPSHNFVSIFLIFIRYHSKKGTRNLVPVLFIKSKEKKTNNLRINTSWVHGTWSAFRISVDVKHYEKAINEKHVGIQAYVAEIKPSTWVINYFKTSMDTR